MWPVWSKFSYLASGQAMQKQFAPSMKPKKKYRNPKAIVKGVKI